MSRYSLAAIAFTIALAPAGVYLHHLDQGNQLARFSEPEPIVTTVLVGDGDPSDPCVVEVDASVYPELKKIGIEEWAAACRASLQDD